MGTIGQDSGIIVFGNDCRDKACLVSTGMLSEYGTRHHKMARQFRLEIPSRFLLAQSDEFVIMPNLFKHFRVQPKFLKKTCLSIEGHGKNHVEII